MIIIIVWICLHSFTTKYELNILMKKYVKIKDFYRIKLLSQKDNMLQFNQYMKLDKKTMYNLCRSWIFHLKIDGHKYYLEKSSPTKAGEHIPWGYSMPTRW